MTVYELNVFCTGVNPGSQKRFENTCRGEQPRVEIVSDYEENLIEVTQAKVITLDSKWISAIRI